MQLRSFVCPRLQTRLLCSLAAAAVLSCVAVPAAMAIPQDQPAAATPPAPPTPDKPDDPPVVLNYLTMLIILAVVIGASLIPSKRGHQD